VSGMPWQLAQSDRRRKAEPRAIVELTPHINVNDIRHIIPRDYNTYTYANSFKYPFTQKLALNRNFIEVFLHTGYTQRVGIHWARTGFGKARAILICPDCHCGARRLFLRYGQLACRFCHRLSYASRANNQIARKRLAASKLRLMLGGLPNISERLPTKPKWQRQRTYRRITNEIQVLEAKAKTQHYRKPISSQLFAYHT